MNILIIDDDNDIRDILEFTLSREVEANFIHAINGEEAIGAIKKYGDIKLIVCDYNMSNGNGGEVYKFLLDSKSEIPYVFCSSGFSSDYDEFKDGKNLLGDITKPFIFDGVQKIIKLYNGTQEESSGHFLRNDSDFIDVGLELLLKTTVLPCDLYVELNDKKNLKMLNKGDSFTISEYEKYNARGIENLFIKREDSLSYIDSVCGDIKLVTEKYQVEKEDRIMDSHTLIMLTIGELGLSDKVIRATTNSVDYALELFKESKDFKKIEKHIFGYPGKYLTTHSVALGFIAVAILAKTKWDSPETRNKLVMAGFLHDACIRVPEFTDSIFGEDTEQINVRENPNEVRKLLEHLDTIPPDLERILLEHREKPDGSGSPKNLVASQLHTLSAVIIVAHDIVDLIFKLHLEKVDLVDENIHVLLNKDKYPPGTFLKVYEAAMKMEIFK